MSSIGVNLRVDAVLTATELHDRWLRLFRRRNEAREVATAMWQGWSDATAGKKSVEADRLWREYSALQSDYRVLAAWTDVVHAAWVFASEGRDSRFLTGHSTPERTPVSVS